MFRKEAVWHFLHLSSVAQSLLRYKRHRACITHTHPRKS